MATVRELRAQFTAQIDGLKSGLRNARTEFQSFRNENEKTIKATQEKWKKAGDTMQTIGRGARNYISLPLLAAAGVSGKAAMDFESAFAGVRKTVDGTEADFKELEKGIRDMAKELPASTTEISAVAEAAGQLGIEKENILGFTRTMIDLGESTNLTADQAATAFARFANITQMPQDQFENLGSAVVDLGNNMATTESEIVEMGMRLAGTGAQIGLTEGDIMALAASMSSVGIEAEAGGTAMSTVMKKMQNAVSEAKTGSTADLEAFAEAAGMSAKDFAHAFETDPITAIDALVKGLGTSGEEGANLNEILETLGITGIRESDTMLRLAGSGELLGEAVEISNSAFEENNALTKEAAQRYETSESKMEIFRNKANDVAITFGQVLLPVAMDVLDWAGEWMDKLAGMDEGTQKMVIAIGAGAAAFGLIMPLVGGLVTAIAPLAGLISAAGGASVVFGGALAALTGPVGIAVGAIAALTLGGIALVEYLSRDALPEIDRFGEGVSESTKKALGSFFELSDGAQEAMMELQVNGTRMTELTADKILSTYEDMNAQILAAMGERHKEEYDVMQTHFANTSALTAEEEAKILEGMTEHNTEQKNKQQALMDEIQEIIERAATEKRETTEEENARISEINKEMNENAVRYMTENQAEQQVILEQMSANADTLTKEQARKVVANSAKQRDDVVAEAESQYDETVAAIIRQRDEAGTITDEQATALIAAAKKQRDETIAHAEDQHEKVVEEAENQAGSLEGIMDTYTGEMYNKWDAYVANVKRKWERQNENLKEDWDTLWTTLKKIMDNKGNNMETALSILKTGLVGKFHTLSTDAQIKIRAMVNGIITGMNWVLGKFGLSKLSLWKPSISGGGYTQKERNMGMGVQGYAEGTDNHPGGPAVVGDGEGGNAGRELIRLPDGRFTLSPDKPTLVDLPRGAMVMAARETKKFLQGIPKYANGIGDIVSHVWGAGKDIFQKGKKVAFDVFDYLGSPGKLFNTAMSMTGFNMPSASGFIGNVLSGGFKMLKDKGIAFIKDKMTSFLSSFGGGAGGGKFGPPFRKTSSYGYRFHPITGRKTFHNGDDWAAPAGTPIPSQGGGTVVASGYHAIRGNYVRVKSGAYERIYQHNSRNLVNVGDVVRPGQIIATVGSTGRSTGPHLHFELLKNGRNIAPSSGGGVLDRMGATGGQNVSMGALYLKAITEDGDWMNDWVTHLPRNKWKSAMSYGRTAANLISGYGSPARKYFEAIAEDGDWMNDWVTHLPRNKWDSIMKVGKQLAGLQGYAGGGIIDKKQLAWLAEGGWAESVISHDPSKAQTQKAIWEKTGDALGFNDDVLGEKILDALERIVRGVQTTADIQLIMSDRKVGQLVSKHAKKEEELERKRRLQFEPQGGY